MTKYLIIAIAVLFGSLVALLRINNDLKKDNERVSLNFNEINKAKDQILNVTLKEYDKLSDKYKIKLDSLLKVTHTKPKQVISATLIKNVYIDTNKVVIVPKIHSFNAKNGLFTLPISLDSTCWSFRGAILSKDSTSRLEITERKNVNNIQLIVTKDKYFLGFLWRTKKGTYKAFSECGAVEFTQINFVK